MAEADEDNVKSLLAGWNKKDMNSSIQKKLEIDAVLKDITTAKDIVTNEIKLYLKERNWTKFLDEETNVSVSLSRVKREDIDKKKLKLLLSSTQYNSIIKIISYEKLNILTIEDRERLKKFIKKNI